MSTDLVRQPEGKPPARVQRASRQTRYLAQSIVLEETGTARLVRIAMMVVSGIVMAFLIWTAITRIEEVAVTFGSVVPSDSVKVVQHLEGGIVDRILVSEGQLVEKGETILVFSESQARSDFEQMLARQASLKARAERLRALGTGADPDFSMLGPQFAGLVADQIAIYQIQRAAYDSARAVVLQQIDQRQAELNQLLNQRASLQQQIDLVSEEVAMRETLLEKGLTPRVVYLDARRDQAQAQADLTNLLGQIASSREALGEARTRLTDLEATRKQDYLNEMGQVTSELAQVTENVNKLDDRVSRLEVRAPARGLIQDMKVKTEGAVLPPGGELLSVVPVDEGLLVETRINTRDIGHIEVGQPVSVKVTAYDFSRYGAVDGKLVRISPTTYMDEENQPYYKGMVELAHPYVGEAGFNPVLPGMSVQADIVTGEKTLMQYLLKPIYVSMEQAFRER